MRRREQQLWDRMRAALGRCLYLERIENAVGVGRPDVDVMWGGVTLPVELKAVAGWPRRAETPVLGRTAGLNRNQLNWWLRWRRCGGAGCILVAVGEGLFAVPGKLSDQVNTLTRAQMMQFQTSWVDFAWAIKEEATCLQSR